MVAFGAGVVVVIMMYLGVLVCISLTAAILGGDSLGGDEDGKQ